MRLSVQRGGGMIHVVMDEKELRTALVDRAIAHSSGTYRATLVHVRSDPRSADAVDLAFTAGRLDGTGDTIRGELHVSLDTFNDRPYLLEAIDNTVTAILDGRLPPGTVQLL